jgi:hypothetical protein
VFIEHTFWSCELSVFCQVTRLQTGLEKKMPKKNNFMSFLKNPFFGLSELAIPKNELLWKTEK